MERDNTINNIFNPSLDLITNGLKDILYLLDDNYSK